MNGKRTRWTALGAMAAVGALAASGCGGSSASHSATGVGTSRLAHLGAADTQSTIRWLAHLRLPAGMRRQPTQARCSPAHGALCVTARGAPRIALARLRAAIRAAGGTLGASVCQRRSKLARARLLECESGAGYRSVAIALVAGIARPADPETSWVSALVAGAP